MKRWNCPIEGLITEAGLTPLLLYFSGDVPRQDQQCIWSKGCQLGGLQYRNVTSGQEVTDLATCLVSNCRQQITAYTCVVEQGIALGSRAITEHTAVLLASLK